MPTTGSFPGEIRLDHLQMTVSDHRSNPFGIQWQRYDRSAPYPELVLGTAHVAFEVNDLGEAISGERVIVAPNSPVPGIEVAFIEVSGAPVELLAIDRAARPQGV